MKLKTHDERLQLTHGDYHRMVKARKPKGIEDKSAYLVGTGIAALAAGCFLIRDAHMEGSKITFLEQLDLPGGCLDGAVRGKAGYVARGGREMGHCFECLFDLFSSLRATEDPEMSVIDYFYYTNRDDPNFSLNRITEKQGQRGFNGKFNLNQQMAMEIGMLVMTPDEVLADKSIEDIFSKELMQTDFWTLWRTMFAFENWHSALEMKLYLARFVHHVDGLTDLSALQFSKHDQYTSFILPMIHYLKEHGVNFMYGTTVENVEFDITPEKKTAKRILYTQGGKAGQIDLTENDLVFITNGSMTENSGYGDDDTPAPMDGTIQGCWKLWKNIAAQDGAFGHPEAFCSDIERSNWESCTVTCHGPAVPKYIEKITGRDPYSGKVCTGGIVTAKDSNWLLSWTVNRQPQYIGQPKDDIIVWVYGLFSDKPGDYIKKQMRDCTGKEITKEWLYHLGVPVDEIEDLAKTCTAIPVMMPFITSHFMPRVHGDRPYCVPKGSVNFAFLGQFAETLDDPGRDTVFTIEYSGRTAMESVYVLTGVEKGVPEVFGSVYDIRYAARSVGQLLDGKKPEIPLPEATKAMLAAILENTEIEKFLKEYQLV